MTTVWLCEPRSHGRNKAVFPLPGRPPVLPYPIDRRLRLCGRVGTRHLFVVIFLSSCVVVRWLTRVQAPPSEGNGCPCARPLEAATGRRAWLADLKERRAAGGLRIIVTPGLSGHSARVGGGGPDRGPVGRIVV